MYEQIRNMCAEHGLAADEAVQVLCRILDTNILNDAQRHVIIMQFEQAADPENED